MVRTHSRVIEVRRVFSEQFALLLYHWYVPVDQSRLEITLELRDRMRNDPLNTYVGIAYEEGSYEILGLVVAYIQDEELFLWQGRSDGLSRREVDKVMEAAYDWARGKDIHVVATVPNRKPDLWVRRWGFKRRGNEVYKEI